MLAAAGVLTWMILWMRKNARTMGGHLRDKVDAAETATAVSVIAFVAVLREGFVGAEQVRAQEDWTFLTATAIRRSQPRSEIRWA